MSKKLAKKFRADGSSRGTLKFRPSQKSFSLPKKILFKRRQVQNIQDKIIEQETDYEASYETVTSSITSLDDEIDFSSDSNELEYSSIETARSACNTSNYFYPNSSCDVLVHYKSVVSKDFSSDPCEFFHQNQPIAASTPKNHSQAFSSHLIKNYDQFSSFIKPIQCSTPLKKPPPHHLYEDYEKMKSFMDFTSQESTIIEPASISLVLPAVQDNQEAINPDVSGINEKLFLNTSILKIAELSECDRDALNASDTIYINKVVNNKDSKFKTKDVGNAFQESIATEKDPICNTFSKENKKQIHRTKRFENKSICDLTPPLKHLKPVIQQIKSVTHNQEIANPGLHSINNSWLLLNNVIKETSELYEFDKVPLTALESNSIKRVVNNKEYRLKTKDVEYDFHETNTMKNDPISNSNSKENRKQVNRSKRLQNIPVCVLTLLRKHPKLVIQQSRSVKDNPGSTHPDIAKLPEHNKDALKTEIYKNISICPLSLPPKHLIPVIQQGRSKIKRNKKISRVMKWGKN